MVTEIEPHDSVGRYGPGRGRGAGPRAPHRPWTVEIDGRTRLTAPSIVIATGARPFVPPIPGLDTVNVLTSDTVWRLREAPRRLLVLGGGPIGCELSQAFARLGVPVTQVEMAPRLMVREDAEVSALVQTSLERDGVQVLCGHRALQAERVGEVQRLWVEHAGAEQAIEFDALLVAVGRQARVTGFGLEELGVPLTKRGTVEVNAQLQSASSPTSMRWATWPGPYQFTHTAAHMALVRAVNAVRPLQAFCGGLPRGALGHLHRPRGRARRAVESEAAEQKIAVEVTRFELHELDRAITESATQGLREGAHRPAATRSGRHHRGAHAGELIAEFVLAMKHGPRSQQDPRHHPRLPDLGRANKYVAGNWKRAHAPRSCSIGSALP